MNSRYRILLAVVVMASALTGARRQRLPGAAPRPQQRPR